jgi:hypothetical protein
VSAAPGKRPRGSDWRGAIALARDATTGVTDLVEAMHRQIANPLSRPPADGKPVRAGGIAGLVYHGVRGVTRLVGAGADALLSAAFAALPPASATVSPEREALVAALNGVLGDRLAEQGNTLAITMSLRSRGRVLRLQPSSLAATLPRIGPRLLVLVHGLCMNDLLWTRDGHDHGAALARELGVTPVYVNYNSGLSIASNGRLLAALLERLVSQWPVELRELSLLTHSMGGLVARRALQVGARSRMDWARRLDRLVFLGTPHLGAPLERGGHGIDLLLGASRFSAPLARLGQVRSAGITDLRHGIDGHLPLPGAVACYAIAAHTGERGDALRSRLLGDGLVPVASALGEHHDPRRALALAPERKAVVAGVNHLQLLNDRRVYARVRDWLSEAPPLHC